MVIVGNDGMRSQTRRTELALRARGHAGATALGRTRYERIVEILGGRGYAVGTAAELGPTLDAALATDGVSCVNVSLGAPLVA